MICIKNIFSKNVFRNSKTFFNTNQIQNNVFVTVFCLYEGANLVFRHIREQILTPMWWCMETRVLGEMIGLAKGYK